MAIFKCKMCGGDLNIIEGENVYECEYCGSKQTVPTADSEKKMTLFARANRLRFGCEFDKAASVYESIVAEFPEEAEAYWGLILCKYGIEYVDDPATGKKIPTCHRSSFESVMEDSNFEMVMEYSDLGTRPIYRDEAKEIERLRTGIIEVSSKEEPYDIFICYKETDPNGERTIDSVIAQDVYDALSEKGYRVFFSRITLEDKLGQEYEPYIFAALNSAKIMLAFGTDYEYYNAVWVKNEWSRFLQLIAKGEKKTLIPCYKGIDAYDMPKEFAKLQAQDMGKVGATQDLLRGIDKILPKQDNTLNQTIVTNVVNQNSSAVEPILKRAFIFLEDEKWNKADEYCERVLDLDPENALAYLGKLMAELHVKREEELRDCNEPFDSFNNYLKVTKYGDDGLKTRVEGYVCEIKERYSEYINMLIKSAKVSDTIAFGRYENHALEWLVLDKQDNMVLVVTKKAVTEKKYNEARKVGVTWETCTLRGWLNDEFLTSTFTDDERKIIKETAVKNDANPEYGTTGGNDTQDKIFLLSIDEAEKYFKNDEERVCKMIDSDEACWWWLRSPGRNSNFTAIVLNRGSVGIVGSNVDYSYGVRPALWINLES